MDKEDGSAANIYVNIDAIKGEAGKEITDSNTTRTQSPQLTGRDSVKIRRYRAATVCLGLLCVLLLAAVIVLCVMSTGEREQLIFKNTNLTEERDALITKYNNITKLGEQLNQQKNELWRQLNDGWIYYKNSLYFISSESKNWNESRRYCTERGADLTIINNREEQDFVQKMSGTELIWIGLSDSDVEDTWKWVDGSILNSSFWKSGEPNSFSGDEDCALSTSSGLADYPCTDAFKWICERRIPK